VDWPTLDDTEAWRAVIKAGDEALFARLEPLGRLAQAAIREQLLGDSRVYIVSPSERSPAADGCVYLYLHGGALLMGGGSVCRLFGLAAAMQSGAETWAVDYRMPPDHPYPAALDDCLQAYRKLLEQYRPDQIIVGGGSAGGNLAAALVLRARDEGLPLPAGLVLHTPELDLTESGDSFRINLGVDTVLPGLLEGPNALYAGGADLTDPYVSPLFGDFAPGYPPTLILTGTRDLFLSNGVRMHRHLRSAGIEAELHVFEAMPHGGFGGAPEDAELAGEIRGFLDAHWGQAAPTTSSTAEEPPCSI
jgi:acetyl esterase/lipase